MRGELSKYRLTVLLVGAFLIALVELAAASEPACPCGDLTNAVPLNHWGQEVACLTSSSPWADEKGYTLSGQPDGDPVLAISRTVFKDGRVKGSCFAATDGEGILRDSAFETQRAYDSCEKNVFVLLNALAQANIKVTGNCK